MLAALDRRLLAELALGALHAQHDLLGGLGLHNKHTNKSQTVIKIGHPPRKRERMVYCQQQNCTFFRKMGLV